MFKKNMLAIYIYKFKILPKKIKNKEEGISSSKDSKNLENNRSSKNSKNKKGKLAIFFKKVITKITIEPLKLLNDLTNNRYKPKIVIKNNMNYSFDDAALTAELFGFMNFGIYSVLSIIGLFLNIVPYIELIPTFSNKTYFDIEFESILSVSLAQIIFILFILIKNIKLKGGVPVRG
ncbi:MAG: DUF2953 domain-containing protein [Sarcina sp.]